MLGTDAKALAIGLDVPLHLNTKSLCCPQGVTWLHLTAMSASCDVIH